MKISEINALLFLFVNKILRQNCIIKLNKMLKLWRIDLKKIVSCIYMYHTLHKFSLGLKFLDEFPCIRILIFLISVE